MHTLVAPQTAPMSHTQAPAEPAGTGAVTGAPRAMLRAEGALVALAGVLAYRHFGYGWGWFAALFLVPDLSMLGYLIGPRAGSVAYNSAHWYGAPALLAALGVLFGHPALFAGAALWLAHVGFDRALGYGLKYPSAFGHTHLGRLGRA